jgi:adenosylcobinamide kinase / adenosylcobinamide-phosphate guanylyltransferase
MSAPGSEPRDVPHLILGGARSGKSHYAEKLLQRFSPPYVYLATAQALDDEMRLRIDEHQRRRGPLWRTMEAPLDLVAQLRGLQGKGLPVLVDCLTLWLTNLLLQRPAAATPPELEVDRLCEIIRAADYPLVLVSNEVGSGIVPENALARAFRDLAGHTNRQTAAACAAVTLVVAGIPLVLKAKTPGSA